MKYRAIGLYLGLICITMTVQARDYKQQFATYGAGDYSCSVYTKAREKEGEQDDHIRQWLAGYVSAFNLIIGDTYDIFGSTDFNGMIKWLDKRCKQFPNANLTNTVARFTEVIYSYRKKVMPDKKK